MQNPPATPRKLTGRPRKGTYTPDKLLEICSRVALGETLTQIAREDGMPSPSAFRSAIARGGPDLQDAWDRARSERPHSIFEEAIDLARQLSAGSWETGTNNQVRALQVAIDALQKTAARLAPRDYGDRQTGAVVVPVQINTSLSLQPGSASAKRTSLYQIEVNTEEPLP